MIASDTGSHPRCRPPRRSLIPSDLMAPHRIHLPGDRYPKCRTCRPRLHWVVKGVGVVEHRPYREVLLIRRPLGLAPDGSLSAKTSGPTQTRYQIGTNLLWDAQNARKDAQIRRRGPRSQIRIPTGFSGVDQSSMQERGGCQDRVSARKCRPHFHNPVGTLRDVVSCKDETSAGDQIAYCPQRTHVVRVFDAEQMGFVWILPPSPCLGEVRPAVPYRYPNFVVVEITSVELEELHHQHTQVL
jgi:hypothetical protein